MSQFRKNPQNQMLDKAAFGQANKALSLLSKSLPASLISLEGRIATVKIEANSSLPIPNITVPLAESEYCRAPLQAGCRGLLIASDVTIAHLSGLGTRKPSIGDMAPNLSASVFLPFSTTSWQEMDNSFLNLYGVKGVKIQQSPGGASITLTNGQIHLDGEVIINGQPYKAHTHINGHEGAPTGGVIS
ncbi:hypothetical protein [Aristophania vespae]|uniref:hypothetical protein n=1 Tax=Aristophania vespae TaxID=2697033 RepID=UPI0023515B89|nr:hypothetical protein [Aristophania vespae]UMM63144.1 hypothetical protein DM15PD_00990 [Aristophania vespae]